VEGVVDNIFFNQAQVCCRGLYKTFSGGKLGEWIVLSWSAGNACDFHVTITS